MRNRLAEKALSLSIIVGILLVPLSALAAIWLTEPDGGAEDVSAPTTVPAQVATEPSQPTTATPVDITADLENACGPEGMQLVSLEETRTITDVQQAALDALRTVCEQQGLPLPPQPVAEPIVSTVVAPAATTTTVAETTVSTLDDHDDDDDDDDDEDD